MKYFSLLLVLLLCLSACVPAESANTLDSLSGVWEPQGISKEVFDRLELSQQGRTLTGIAYRDGVKFGDVEGEVFDHNFVFTVTEENGDYYETNGSVYDIFMSGLYRFKDSRDRILSNGTFKFSWQGLQ